MRQGRREDIKRGATRVTAVDGKREAYIEDKYENYGGKKGRKKRERERGGRSGESNVKKRGKDERREESVLGRGSCQGVHRCRSRLFILPVALTMSEKERRRNRERGAEGVRGRMENKNGETKKGERKEVAEKKEEGKSSVQFRPMGKMRRVRRNKTSSKRIMPFGGCARARALLRGHRSLQPIENKA